MMANTNAELFEALVADAVRGELFGRLPFSQLDPVTDLVLAAIPDGWAKVGGQWRRILTVQAEKGKGDVAYLQSNTVLR